MKLELLLLMCVIVKCLGLRLGPLENNDKLQDITKLYVAEWQWESWPVKQDIEEKGERSQGQRKNFALWRNNLKSAWYLFGGQSINENPKKVYSDVWKFTVKTRAWKKFLSTQIKMKKTYSETKDGPNSPQLIFVDEANASYFEPAIHNIVLCGGLEKKNLTNTKSDNLWINFRRKKFEKEKPEEELSYLAIYAQKTPKSSAVWQIDLKTKTWTSNFCCCEKENKTVNVTKTVLNKTKIRKLILNKTLEKKVHVNVTKNACIVFDSQINNVEDEVDLEQLHLSISDLKNKKKRINQFKKTNDKLPLKVVNTEKERKGKKEMDVNERKFSSGHESFVGKNNTFSFVNNSKHDITNKKKDHILKSKNTPENLKGKVQIQKLDKLPDFKATSQFCPNLNDDGARLTWCDGKNEAFVTVDVNSSLIMLWVFDLKKRMWSQVEVKNCDKTEWSSCSNINSIRYAGNDEEVYIICSQTKTQNNASKTSFLNLTNPSKIPSESNFNTKLIYKINYKERVLRSFGKIKLNPFFDSLDGEEVWRNDTLSILRVFKNSENETILILAYSDIIDLWILSKNQEGKERFNLIEKIWRGSALKWFDKYNAVLYNLQFVSEFGTSDTILIPNPRDIGANDYWPRERGRFIIRIFRNENLKNQTFENRTREQNLTYELLQSDYRPPGSEQNLNQMYSLKVVVFFGISLTIFTVFGFVIFLKKCVNCPPRIRIQNEYQKSPVVVRYSVIPDDLLYPVT